MLTITVAAIKGGTGKTTTAAALAQAAAQDGKSVLCVDLDPQGNLSAALAAHTGVGSLQAMTGRGLPAQHTEQGIDVLAACPDLATLTVSAGAAGHLQTALQAAQGDYDLCLIDTPPTAGILVYAALAAADKVLVPLETDTGSIQGLQQIARIAAEMGRPISGVVLTRYNGRTKINQHIAGLIQKACDQLSATYYGGIRQGIAIRECQALQRSLYQYAPGSNPALDYWRLYQALCVQAESEVQAERK